MPIRLPRPLAILGDAVVPLAALAVVLAWRGAL